MAHRDSQNKTKSNPVEQTPTGSFLLPKWGGFESKRKNRFEKAEKGLELEERFKRERRQAR